MHRIMIVCHVQLAKFSTRSMDQVSLFYRQVMHVHTFTVVCKSCYGDPGLLLSLSCAIMLFSNNNFPRSALHQIIHGMNTIFFLSQNGKRQAHSAFMPDVRLLKEIMNLRMLKKNAFSGCASKALGKYNISPRPEDVHDSESLCSFDEC